MKQAHSRNAHDRTNAPPDPVDLEFGLHLDLATDDLIRQGMSPDSARAEALRRFGDWHRLRRECHRVSRRRRTTERRAAAVNSLLTDLRFAFRSYRTNPAFFALALVTLSLGIGASVTIFSVVDSIVLQPLPYANADRLVVVGTVYGDDDSNFGSSSPRDFFAWAERNSVFETIAASRRESLILLTDGKAENVQSAAVSAEFFSMLGANALVGRVILPEDDRIGGNRVVVLSHGTWQQRWGGDPDVIGTSVTLSEEPHTIVGVMPPSFVAPEAIYHSDATMWLPLAFVRDDLTSDDGFLQIIGQLREDVSLEEARAAMNVLATNLANEAGTGSDGSRGRRQRRVGMAPLQERTVGNARPTLMVLLGAVGFLLLIACANVANLFLARATGREREIAVRAALGAGRGRIVQQLLTESICLALVGGVLGVAMAYAGVAAFVASSPPDIPRLAEVGVDYRALFFAAGVSLTTGLLFGLAPALHLSHHDVTGALKEGGLATTPGRQRHGLRATLVIIETAVAIVLLAGAGLLINSFIRLNSVDPGFEPEGALRMALYLERYETGEGRSGFFERLLEQIRAIPGVDAAGVTSNLPMTQNQSSSRITIAGYTNPGDDPEIIDFHNISSGYFDALGAALLTGRDLLLTDHANAPPVAVVNEAFATRYFESGDPLGQQFKFGREDSGGSWFTVVGVVSDLNQLGLGQPSGPEIFLSHLQAPRVFMNVVVRASTGTEVLATALRETVWRLDPALPISALGTMSEQTASTIIQPRFYALLLTVFATVAMILAASGLYGALSYIVKQRGHEMGIRMALGARRADVLKLVTGQGMALAAVGIVLGLVAAFWLSKALGGMLYGITNTDITTYMAVVLGLAAVAGVASYLPARRATNTDPATTLRTE